MNNQAEVVPEVCVYIFTCIFLHKFVCMNDVQLLLLPLNFGVTSYIAHFIIYMYLLLYTAPDQVQFNSAC